MAEAGVPVLGLPSEGLVFDALAETPLPELNPIFQGYGFVVRRAEEAEMVGHQDVAANAPSGGFAPGFEEGCVDGFVGQPRAAVFGADGKEDDGGTGGVGEDAVRWFSAADFVGVA